MIFEYLNKNCVAEDAYILFANSCITLSFEFYFHITVDSTNDIGSLNEHINTSVLIDTYLEKSFQNSFLHSYSSFKHLSCVHSMSLNHR